MRVLLIDDDVRLAELLDGYLAPQGVALVHAAGGQAGLAALAGGGFDAVLLDVMMPGLDGLAVLRRLRDAGHRIPVLMLTARGDEADRRADAFRAFVPSAGGGLGLGLALVSRIAVAHGGGAWIDDRPGGGARVGFGVEALPEAAG